MRHDRRIEEMNASASAVQSWYKSNLRRIVEEKERLDMQKLLLQKNLEEIALSKLRGDAAAVLQRAARCATAGHSYRQQLAYTIRYEALAASRDKAWTVLKGFSLIIRAKAIAARKRMELQLLLLKNDPNKASGVICRAVRARGGQLMRLQWLNVGRFAMATQRLQQMRKGAGHDIPKMAASVHTRDDGDNIALDPEVLEDALMQMELALRSQSDNRQDKRADSSFVISTQDAPSAPSDLSNFEETASAENMNLFSVPDMRKAAAAAPSHSKRPRAAAARALKSRSGNPSSGNPARASLAALATGKPRMEAKNTSNCMPVSLPVGSVVFSIRQLSEKKSNNNHSKDSLSKSRAGYPGSAFSQVSELFSSSPSRCSSSARALQEADAARHSALNGAQNRDNSGSSALASAFPTRGHGLEDDGDESSGQLPIGVLEAIMVRPHTRVVEQDKRLLKLALDTENK